MLRITEQHESAKTLRLRLDGTVDGTSFAELQHACSENNNHIVVLDMTGVMFMSEDAACQLAKLRCGSLHIVNCSPFLEMLLNSVSD